jgi:hypothetical protein
MGVPVNHPKLDNFSIETHGFKGTILRNGDFTLKPPFRAGIFLQSLMTMVNCKTQDLFSAMFVFQRIFPEPHSQR